MRRTLERGFVPALALAVLGATYWRLFYGVDFTDEAWYVAVPYRFVLGARPYLDETSVPQTTTGIVLYPFLWVYHALAGRDGLILFVRHLHFLFSAAVGAAVFSSLRRTLGRATAAFAGLSAVAFVPFDIPSMSYNSLGSGLFTAGSFLGFLAVRQRAARLWAGSCLGLAAFVYPPLLLAVAVACALRLALTTGHRRGDAVSVVVPALGLPLVGFVALAGVFGLHQIVGDYHRSSHYLGEAGGLAKLQRIAAHEWATLPLWYLLFTALALVALCWRRGPRLAALLVAVLPVLVIPPHLTSYAASLEYVAHYGWLALPLFLALRKRPDAIELFATVWLPALAAGLTTAYSSANGGVNFGVGFFPAALVSSIFVFWSIERLLPGWLSPGAMPVALVTAILLAFGLVPVYRDGPLGTLNARVASGPFAGLLTSRHKRAFLERLQHDLDGVTAACRVSFFNDFPAGYLLTDARPETNAAWTATVSRRDVFSYHGAMLRYYLRHGFPDTVVLMRRIPFAPPASARLEHYSRLDPLLVALRTHGYHVIAARLDYLVYRRGRC